MPSNKAAWIVAAKANPFEVKDAPFPIPGPKEVIVRNAFVAVNPLEFKIQDHDPPVGGRSMVYPTILGADLSGTISEVGSGVTTFEVGSRVIANAVGAPLGRPEMSAFQFFTLLSESSPTLVPDHISLEAAVVLPLACDTAMAGLFVADQLGLSTALLEENPTGGAPGLGSNEVVLIWGGSSSVGCCAIQFARAAGYEVYTTASRRNHALCASVGANRVFDYSDTNVESEIVAALHGRKIIGALDCIADEDLTVPACSHILARTEARGKVITVLTPPADRIDEGVELQRLSIPALRSSPVYDIVHGWMAKGLRSGALQPKPDPYVIGEGLENIQAGVDKVKRGVSALKVIVKLHGEGESQTYVT